MTNITLSSHAKHRIQHRLNTFVSCAEVLNQCRKMAHREYIRVKRIPYTEIPDPKVKPDGIARGDLIVAVLRDGIITTVMLRKSFSNSNEYRRV